MASLARSGYSDDPLVALLNFSNWPAKIINTEFLGIQEISIYHKRPVLVTIFWINQKYTYKVNFSNSIFLKLYTTEKFLMKKSFLIKYVWEVVG